MQEALQEIERGNKREILTQKNTYYNTLISQISITIQALTKLSRIEEVIPIKLFLNPKTKAINNIKENNIFLQTFFRSIILYYIL